MNIKILVISFLALFAIGGGLTMHIKSQNKIDVQFVEEVPQVVFPDGRYQAGSAAKVIVNPSPAIVWEITGKTSKAWRIAAFIVIGLVAVYLGLCGAGVISYKHGPFFAGLSVAAGCWIGAYSSAFENNAKTLTPQEYEAVKDNLKSLWTPENLIR